MVYWELALQAANALPLVELQVDLAAVVEPAVSVSCGRILIN